MAKDKTKNILATKLQPCSTDPMTGFFRDGFCNTNQLDQGTHVVCADITQKFLKFTKSRGNDLSSPRPRFNFPGLKAGDGWCLCALRWKEAYEAGVAPLINSEATHEKALEYIPRKILKDFYVE